MGHSSRENTAGISLFPSGARTDNWTCPFCRHVQSIACIKAYSFARRLWLAWGVCTEEWQDAKACWNSPLQMSSGRGQDLQDIVVPMALPCTKKQGKGERRRGQGYLHSQQCRQVIASRQHQRLPKSPCCPRPWRPHIWQCRSSTAIAAGWFMEEDWLDGSPLCCPVPPVVHGTWWGSSCTPPPRTHRDPLQRSTCVGSWLPMRGLLLLRWRPFLWDLCNCPACKPWEVTMGLTLWVALTRPDRLRLPKSWSESDHGAFFFFLATWNNHLSGCFYKMQRWEVIC